MILVTGGAGYIGSRLLTLLLEAGNCVRVVDTRWFDSQPPPHPRLELITADLADFNSIWLSGVSDIIHLAGLSNDATAEFAPDLALRSNVQVSAVLAEAAAAEAVHRGKPLRCIFASTCSVYYEDANQQESSRNLLDESDVVHPKAIYSRSKRAAELELLKVSCSEPLFCPLILRMGTVFGYSPRMRFDLVLNRFTLDAWSGRPLVLEGVREIWRPILHIDDAVDTYLALLRTPADRVKGRIYNLLSRNCLISDLAHEVTAVLQQACGVAIEIVRDRNVNNGGRSYRVNGGKIREELAIDPSRDIRPSVLEMWEKLQSGRFGKDPTSDSRYFNIRWLIEHSRHGTGTAKADQMSGP